LYRALPPREEARILGKQILRSGTSVGQTIGLRAGRGRGPNSSPSWAFVLEEVDETVFWLELLLEGGILKHEKLDTLVREAQELTSIFVTSLRTAKGIAS
jgi:four helix bundle protein